MNKVLTDKTDRQVINEYLKSYGLSKDCDLVDWLENYISSERQKVKQEVIEEIKEWYGDWKDSEFMVILIKHLGRKDLDSLKTDKEDKL